MKQVIITASVSLCLSLPAGADGCDHGLSGAPAADLKSAIQLREGQKYPAAQASLRTLDRDAPNTFCVLYELGRVALNLQDHDAALAALTKAANIATPADHSKQAIYNILGYTHLQMKQLDPAIANFLRQQANPSFGELPQATRTKVYNNTGFAFLAARQFEQAQSNFKQAAALGSKLAQSNLDVVASMLAVQRAGDKNIPGIYGVALFSTKDETRAREGLNRMADTIGVDPSKLHLFRRSSGVLTATFESNISYALAEDLMKQLHSQGINGANIVATSRWGELQPAK